MNRSTILWITVIIFLVLPASGGRFILDMAGGVLFFLLLLPILLTGAGWVLWKIIKSKMRVCTECGAQYFGEISQCSICGASMYKGSNNNNLNIPASSATIDVTPSQVDK